MTCFSWLLGRKESASIKHSLEIKELSIFEKIVVYPYKELKLATGNFSFVNKLGEGGFGCVYKGKLKGGAMAAVKVLSAESRQGVKEFLTEIKVISDVRHDNLVKLLGCCIEGDHRILVYEYVENNNLAEMLFAKSGSSLLDMESIDHGGIRKVQISWKMRTNICIGIARGIAYLHEEISPHIIHRDIKASNILLDSSFTPKIADFGLAKFFPPNVTHVSTRVAGTIGYLAPEYAVRGRLTRKADIYSFGVVLLEIVSGRCNKDNLLPTEEQYLLEWLWELYEANELEKVVDLNLHQDYDLEEACRFLRVGLLCTQDLPKLRPSMSSVVKMLTGESRVDSEHIRKPGLLSDLMDMRTKTARTCDFKAASPTFTTSNMGSSSSL